MLLRATLAAALISLGSEAAMAVPSDFEPVREGVYVVRDDTGRWGGHMSNSITHQSAAPYQARKVLDLSAVPAAVWDAVREVRVSVYFMVRDYSWHDRPPANGLDEAFEIVVNGHVHAYPTSCGAPVFAEGLPPTIGWHDFELPKAEFARGPNEVTIRKAPSEKNDDYLYLGIDNTEQRGNSSVTFDGEAWTQERLTVPGGNGEYMVRLYLLTEDTLVQARWHPGTAQPLDDPHGLIAFAGSEAGEAGTGHLGLGPGQDATVEWDPQALDPLRPIEVTVTAAGELELAWLDAQGKPMGPTRLVAPFRVTHPAGASAPVSGLRLAAAEQPVTVTEVSVQAGLSCRPAPARIDMCPRIAPARGKPEPREPYCRISEAVATLGNTGLRCRFEVGEERLRLASLYNRYTECDMVGDPQDVSLFLVEVGEQRYAGSRDFRCLGVRPEGDAGFTAVLELPEPALRATLSGRMEDEGLRLGLELTNAGALPVDFRLAFPHLAGLTASGDAAADCCFFPWGGGIIADRPATIRRGYGDHEALYQVMDVFSPVRGGGLYVRADDAEGWHKTLALRKHVPGTAAEDAQQNRVLTRPEYQWQNPLGPVPGIGVAYEYLRLTREPGASFRPAEAVLSAHPGDWHVAMRAYADWAHRVWRFRPYPSRLRSVHHMIATGWGQDVLFRDGRYRADFVQPNTDCIELMSWWDWSPLGPWSTPFDRLSEVLTEAQIKGWEPYFVKDPVTGQTMWNNQPGDYDGYNERFGGLPAFRDAIGTYQQMGALTTLYTDPIRCDDATKMGQAHGREWDVVGADGEPVKSYDVWTMCHDVAEYRQWVADTMGRVMRETGADGIRLDEYGHLGWACYSTLHQHTFAEPGVSQWLKAIAETCRLVRQRMDEVVPGSVLTTEHPGYDYLLQFLEGCITYDLTVQATPLRPLECNLQRFYFPECKAYELDHMGVDPGDRKKLWNAVESFGRYYPPAAYAILKENEDVYQSHDCEPLVPTLRQYVYGNRFSGGGKTIYHLYNATGHTVEGPLLALDMLGDHHVFDLLRCREVRLQQTERVGGAGGSPAPGEGVALALYLPRDEVACVAVLPQTLRLERAGPVLTVRLPAPVADGRVVVCDAQQQELLAAPLEGRSVEVDVGQLGVEGQPACIKVLAGRDLVDIAAVPAA